MLNYFISHGSWREHHMFQNIKNKIPIKSLHNTTAEFRTGMLRAISFLSNVFVSIMVTYHATLPYKWNSGLSPIFATAVTWHDLVQKWSFSECRRSNCKWSSRSRVPTFIMALMVSVNWHMTYESARFQWSVAFENSFSLTKCWKMAIQEMTPIYCSGVILQHVKLCGFNTV